MAGSTARVAGGGLFAMMTTADAAPSAGTTAAESNKSSIVHNNNYQQEQEQRSNPPPRNNAHEKSKRLLEQAQHLLRQVEESYLLQTNGPNHRGKTHQLPEATTSANQQVLHLVLGSSGPDVMHWNHPSYAHRFPASLPAFDRSEVVVGALLGVGGFCSVYQIDSFDVRSDDVEEAEDARPTKSVATLEKSTCGGGGGGGVARERIASPSPNDRFWTGRKRVRHHHHHHNGVGIGGGGTPTPLSATSSTTTISSSSSSDHSLSTLDSGSYPFFNEQDLQHHAENFRPDESGMNNSISRNPASRARVLMKMRAQRRKSVLQPGIDGGASDVHCIHDRISSAHAGGNKKSVGEARYAIKRLHWESLNEFERTRGAIDLAMEAMYLSALSHPNIIKMRGVASGDILDRNFFIILDRLYGTLDDKIKSWKQAQTEYDRGGSGWLFGWWWGPSPKCKEETEHLMIERLIVAYDLSSALSYMHKNRLVYRDVKKENVGFDVRGDVKIFDFGLSKCLSPELRARDPETGKLLTHGYRLTPRTGSIHTMAPEVASGLPYDEKCDVFSFAVLLWEMLALQSPFRSYTRREYMFRVVEMQERPWIHHRWPGLVKKLLKEAWNDDPRRRPGMKRVSAMLREELNALTDAPEVRNRTIHLLNRSTHSFCLEPRNVQSEREIDVDRDYSSDGEGN